MINVELAKRELLEAANKLQQKKKLSSEVGPDHYDPGRMENLEQYFGVYDAEKNKGYPGHYPFFNYVEY